jgi:hypothetical protein
MFFEGEWQLLHYMCRPQQRQQGRPAFDADEAGEVEPAEEGEAAAAGQPQPGAGEAAAEQPGPAEVSQQGGESAGSVEQEGLADGAAEEGATDGAD